MTMRDCDPDNAGSPQDQTKYIPTAANTDILSVSVAAGNKRIFLAFDYSASVAGASWAGAS